MDCEGLGEEPSYISFIETGPDGMMGVYDPDPYVVTDVD